MRILWVVIFLVACGQPVPHTASRPAGADRSALEALRAGAFDEAERTADAQLAGAPNSSQAAAVRAIARYGRAESQLVGELRALLMRGEVLKALDHERGRAAWLAFLTALEAIDADLAVAAADPDFVLELCPACLEHDWNGTGRVDDGDRHLLELEYDGKGGSLAPGDPRRRPTYRFDHGDVLWARAMLSFQRAAVELVLAYRWSELDKLFRDRDERITLKLVDPGRTKHAGALVLAALGFSDQSREAYLAETDDDREWVPSPRQKNYAMPLAVDDHLYGTWTDVLGDLHRLLDSEEGIPLREVAGLLDGPKLAAAVPDAYVDLGRMLREPSDVVIDATGDLPPAQKYERLLRGLLGHGYTESMRASPLVGRVRHMAEQVDRGEDTFERKLRYLFWLN
jgi:hypothetical protein